jgi:hypothetical protein
MRGTADAKMERFVEERKSYGWKCIGPSIGHCDTFQMCAMHWRGMENHQKGQQISFASTLKRPCDGGLQSMQRCNGNCLVFYYYFTTLVSKQ